MFIFCLCDVGYWIRFNKVQKVKRKNMLPKYVGSFKAEVRTVYFFHHFEVSSPFRGILRRNSEAIIAHLITFGCPKYTNILEIRSTVALHTNICPEIFFDHLKGYLSALYWAKFQPIQRLSTSINKRFVRGTFFPEKYSPKEKNCLERK